MTCKGRSGVLVGLVLLVGCGGGGAHGAVTDTSTDQGPSMTGDQAIALSIVSDIGKQALYSMCKNLDPSSFPGSPRVQEKAARLGAVAQVQLLGSTFGPQITRHGGDVSATAKAIEQIGCGTGQLQGLGPYFEPVDMTNDPRFPGVEESAQTAQHTKDRKVAYRITSQTPASAVNGICGSAGLSLLQQARLTTHTDHLLQSKLGPEIRAEGASVPDTVQQILYVACGAGPYRYMGPYTAPVDRAHDPRFNTR